MRTPDADNPYKDFSISKKLKEYNKSNDYFELMLSNISLEDLIALKLEVTYRIFGKPIYGIPIWRSLPKICKSALIRYFMSICKNKFELALLLNAKKSKLDMMIKKENVLNLFSNEKKK